LSLETAAALPIESRQCDLRGGIAMVRRGLETPSRLRLLLRLIVEEASRSMRPAEIEKEARIARIGSQRPFASGDGLDRFDPVQANSRADPVWVGGRAG